MYCFVYYDNVIVQLTVRAVCYDLHHWPQIDWCWVHHMTNIINIHSFKYHNNSVSYIPWEHIFSHTLFTPNHFGQLQCPPRRNWTEASLGVLAGTCKSMRTSDGQDKHSGSSSLSNDPCSCIWLAFRTTVNSCIQKNCIYCYTNHPSRQVWILLILFNSFQALQSGSYQLWKWCTGTTKKVKLPRRSCSLEYSGYECFPNAICVTSIFVTSSRIKISCT